MKGCTRATRKPMHFAANDHNNYAMTALCGFVAQTKGLVPFTPSLRGRATAIHKPPPFFVRVQMVYLERCKRGRAGTRLLHSEWLKLCHRWGRQWKHQTHSCSKNLARNLGTRRQTCRTSSGGSSNKEKELT